jgi:hypothetical protein
LQNNQQFHRRLFEDHASYKSEPFIWFL